MLGASSFLLVGFYQNWKRNRSGLLVFFRNRVGDSFLLISFSFLFYSNFSFFLTNRASFIIFFVILILLTRITKRAQFPVSNWLPAAIAAPTPVSALVHSSTLVTAGVLLLSKFYFFFKHEKIQLLLFLIGFTTILVAGISALGETDFKKLVAFSTLRQIGFLFFILGNGFFWLTFFHLFIHAFIKRVLFFLVGKILHFSFNLQDYRGGKNNAFFSRYILTLTQLVLFSLCGLFFLSGFFSKDYFLERILRPTVRVRGLPVFIVFSLTFFYRIKMVSCFFLTNKNSIFKLESSQQFLFSRVILGVFSILLGKFMRWNFVIFLEQFLFNEKSFIILFMLLLSFYVLIKKGSQLGSLLFYLNFITYFLSKFFQLKRIVRLEKRRLELLNINLFKNSIIFYQNVNLNLINLKTFFLVIITLLVLLIVLVFRIKSL